MTRKNYQLLREEAQERLEVSREGKPEARWGRSRQQPDTNKGRATRLAHNRKVGSHG